MATLPNDIHDRITTLCNEGDLLAGDNHYDEARDKYVAAYKLLPEPKDQWDAATWIFTAIGDVRFKQGDYEKSYKAFSFAIQCPSGLGNPFIHLRLGQLHFEFEHEEKALDELMRAYMGAGKEIFDEDNPKYFAFLANHVEL
jgi:tetratricopeptide (TPR) repeat protein